MAEPSPRFTDEVSLSWALDAAAEHGHLNALENRSSRASSRRSRNSSRVARSPSPLREARRSAAPYARRSVAMSQKPPKRLAVDQLTQPPTTVQEGAGVPCSLSEDETRAHSKSLLAAVTAANVGAQERRRGVETLIRFLAAVSAASENPTQMAAAEALADGLRKTDALGLLAAMASSRDGSDASCAFACLANLAELGLIDALCQDGRIRGAVIEGLCAVRKDERLAIAALPCASHLVQHHLMRRALCSSAGRVTPMLARQLHPAHATSPEAEMIIASSARTILQAMRKSRAQQRERTVAAAVLRNPSAVLREASGAAPGGATRSASSRLAAWLRPARKPPSTAAASASRIGLGNTVTV